MKQFSYFWSTVLVVDLTKVFQVSEFVDSIFRQNEFIDFWKIRNYIKCNAFTTFFFLICFLQNAITIFTEKSTFFRQINDFTSEFTKELLSQSGNFWQKFRESNVFTKEMIWRIIFSVWVNFSHCALTLSWKKFRERNVFSYFHESFYSYSCLFTIFLNLLEMMTFLHRLNFCHFQCCVKALRNRTTAAIW